MRRLLLIFPLLLLFDVANARRHEDVHFFNPDGTRNVYFCDTVSMTNYVIVQSGKTGHKFLIPDSTYQIKKQGLKYWNSKNAFLYIECFNHVADFDWKQEGVLSYWINFPFHPKEKDYKLWTICEDSDKDEICSFPEVKPTVFLLFFIRGDAINHITFYNIIDGWIKGPLKFKDPYAFYPVYIPYKDACMKNK